jgi:hypothetical protein
VHDFDNLILDFWCGASSLRSRAAGSLAYWHSQTASCTTGTCNPTINGVNERGVMKIKSQRHASSCEIKLADYQCLGNLGRFNLRMDAVSDGVAQTLAQRPKAQGVEFQIARGGKSVI